MAEVDAGSAESISAAENALRDLIESELTTKLGVDWLDKCGSTPERIALWKARQSEDQKRREGTVVSDGLLNFSDLTDLQIIIDKNWDRFSACLGKKKTFDVYIERLVDFRQPKMHSRSLLPFERSLIDGITGEIRNKVTIYRSGVGPNKEYFPRIEQVRDSFGNAVEPALSVNDTKLILHPGEVVRLN